MSITYLMSFCMNQRGLHLERDGAMHPQVVWFAVGCPRPTSIMQSFRMGHGPCWRSLQTARADHRAFDAHAEPWRGIPWFVRALY